MIALSLQDRHVVRFNGSDAVKRRRHGEDISDKESCIGLTQSSSQADVEQCLQSLLANTLAETTCGFIPDRWCVLVRNKYSDDMGYADVGDPASHEFKSQ